MNSSKITKSFFAVLIGASLVSFVYLNFCPAKGVPVNELADSKTEVLEAEQKNGTSFQEVALLKALGVKLVDVFILSE